MNGVKQKNFGSIFRMGWIRKQRNDTLSGWKNNMFAGDGNFKLRIKTDDIRIQVTWSQNSF
jgi:hypothetical protein